MTINEGVEYLVNSFPDRPDWQKVIRAACESRPIWFRKNVNFLNRPHSSRLVSVKVAPAMEARDVFQFMLQHGRYSAPCWPNLGDRKIWTGKIDSLYPLNDSIVRLVDESTMRIINVTLPNHILFPGCVVVQVNTRHKNCFVDVTGFGVGNFGPLNRLGGPILFEEIISGIPSAWIAAKRRASGSSGSIFYTE